MYKQINSYSESSNSVGHKPIYQLTEYLYLLKNLLSVLNYTSHMHTITSYQILWNFEKFCFFMTASSPCVSLLYKNDVDFYNLFFSVWINQQMGFLVNCYTNNLSVL